MKKLATVVTAVALLASSCTSNTGQGAAVGAQFGAVLGSAIGGITGGWRGSDIGSIVGMAGGAAVGAAVGAAADKKQAEREAQLEKEREERYRKWKEQQAEQHGGQQHGGQQPRGQQPGGQQPGGQQPAYDDSGFDPTNGADDRIDFDGAGPRGGRGGYSVAKPRTFDPTNEPVAPEYSVRYNSLIEIRNARMVDADRDGVIRAGEECKVTFEIMNRSSMVLYDVQPTVIEVTKNKHIYISPNLHVESIAPNSGVRYTATIRADKRLKDGTAVIRVAVAQGDHEITSQVKEFTVQTSRK